MLLSVSSSLYYCSCGYQKKTAVPFAVYMCVLESQVLRDEVNDIGNIGKYEMICECGCSIFCLKPYR